jgi:HEAT repeat protein
MPKDPTLIPFSQVIQALLDENKPFQARFLYRLSDISSVDFASLATAWPDVSQRRRQALMEDIQEMNESDYLRNFSQLSRLALQDPYPPVRVLAIQTLAEYEEPDYAEVFIEMMEHDLEAQVRAASASALGTYIYLGEIEEIPDPIFREVETSLLGVMRGKDVSMVRRRALEALGFSSREEVEQLINEAYESGDRDWLISSLFAMGRSYNAIWQEKVLTKLDDPDAGVRAEAAEAAGELTIKKSAPKLLEMLEDDDFDVRAAAIWSLSEIGGDGVRETLEVLLEETEDDQEADLLEDALDNLDFVEGMGGFSLLDLDEEDETDDEDDLFDNDLEDDETERG